LRPPLGPPKLRAVKQKEEYSILCLLDEAKLIQNCFFACAAGILNEGFFVASGEGFLAGFVLQSGPAARLISLSARGGFASRRVTFFV